MGCSNSSQKPEQKKPETKPEEKVQEEAKAPPQPEPVKPEPTKSKQEPEAEPHLKVGDKVIVSAVGGDFEAEVLRCNTTDVLVKNASEALWVEIESIQGSCKPEGPPLQYEVRVGQRISSVRGVVGTVVRRTTTEVVVKKDNGEEATVDIEEILYLRVGIRGALGVRNADTFSTSDPYCTCQLEGKPETKVQTQTIRNDLDPEWNFEVNMVNYEKGDTLVFEVKDKDLTIKGDDFLGRAKLTSDQFDGKDFNGKIQLEDDNGSCKGCLYVQARVMALSVPEPEQELPEGPVVEDTQAPVHRGWCW